MFNMIGKQVKFGDGCIFGEFLSSYISNIVVEKIKRCDSYISREWRSCYKEDLVIVWLFAKITK